MKIVLVTGAGFHVGAGALMLLAAAQLADRRHRVVIVSEGRDASLVKASDVQGFVAGEMLGVAELAIGMAGLVKEVSAEEAPPALTKALKKVADEATAAATAAARQRQEADDKRVAEAAKAADEADQRRWSEEWDTLEAVRTQFGGDKARFLAARREDKRAAARKAVKPMEGAGR